MFKRNLISATFSAIVFTMLCLFPSVAPAQAPGELQQQKDPPPPKKSKPSTHYNRTGVGRFDPIMIHLGKASGDKVASRKIADADSDGKISEAEGTFDFGVLPAGEYELRFSDADGHSDATANRGITINTTHVEYSNAGRIAAGNDDPKHKSDVGRLTVTLRGVIGGTLKQELKAELGSQIGSEVARAGKLKFKNILLKADGRSAVKGTLRHDPAMNSIQNMK